jgi:hypothetical protein
LDPSDHHPPPLIQDGGGRGYRSVALNRRAQLRLSASAGVGFVGVSDGLTDLRDGKLDWTYASTGDQAGNTMMTGALPRLRQSSRITRDFVIGFGDTAEAAQAAADGSFQTGLDAVLARFVGEERGVVGREAPATKGTLRGDVH